MKVKTSITLEVEILNRIDGILVEHETRSAFFQDAVIQLAKKREQEKRNLRDLEILKTQASELNEEALDNLAFVGNIFEERGTEQP